VPDDDRLEAYWRAYFASIFNPARLKIAAMTSEMPKKYWRNLPEAAAIPELVRHARERTEAMVERPVVSSERAARVRPQPAQAAPGGLQALAAEASGCRLCGLYKHATQTVFGEGPFDARLMLVGEQPGDQEDLAGRPFVGPAGQMLDRVLAEAGVPRATVYVTNAVKHFKFEPRGKRRIHATPDASEIELCRFWLDQEREIIKPVVTVLLGASAARAVLGRPVTISRERGRRIALTSPRRIQPRPRIRRHGHRPAHRLRLARLKQKRSEPRRHEEHEAYHEEIVCCDKPFPSALREFGQVFTSSPEADVLRPTFYFPFLRALLCGLRVFVVESLGSCRNRHERHNGARPA
jgi:uracil-DNA glycosylase family protein